ncbi:AraC family ligand binding domain-containing protein [Variovorax sp. WS11]|uniref:AraC family ligand binding domain-containing protein n=1 Tax=Variovorax sp. WS11 TaxID=1105204 RepID=UPI001EF2C18A|nr:AraC family ligand binding domain-containing protein [Variovorax sp. WS11]
MDLLHADFTTHEYAPHVHDSLVVAVTEAGGSESKSRGRTDVAHPQALLVFNPSEPHSGRMGGSERWRYRSFYLAESAIQDVLDAVGIDQPGYFTSNVVRDPDLVARFLTLHRVLDGEPQDALLHRELVVRTFGDLAPAAWAGLPDACLKPLVIPTRSHPFSNSCATAMPTA